MGHHHTKEDPWSNMGVPDFEPITRGNPQWMPIGKKCRECGEHFNVFVWPRHCESCGSVFCQRCCYKRPILHNHLGCGMCVAEASVIIRQTYEAKRRRQMDAHNALYHPHDEPPRCKCEVHSPTGKKPKESFEEQEAKSPLKEEKREQQDEDDEEEKKKAEQKE